MKERAWGNTLELEVEEAAGFPSIRLHGEGERRGAARLRELAEELIRNGKTDIIVDARGVRFLDPDSAEALSAVMARLEEEGGALVIIDQSQPVERALKLLGMEQLAHVVATPEQAVRYLRC